MPFSSILQNVSRLLRSIPGTTPKALNLGASPTLSARLINELLRINAGKSYLEVGVRTGATLQCVKAEQCTGVDPYPLFDFSDLPPKLSFHRVPSDDFFATLPLDARYDVIFLDGLHTAEQTSRDLVNALDHLRVGGAILIDDTVPCDALSAIPDYEESLQMRRKAGPKARLKGTPWHGDVYKLMGFLYHYENKLGWVTIVDRGNPQTLVWRSDSRNSNFELSSTMLLSESYESLFGDERQIPARFNPVSVSEALQRYESVLNDLG